MADPGWWPDRLTTWVDRVDDHWRVLGVSEERRVRLRLDLVVDLGQALRDGAAAADLDATDPRLFAWDVLLAEGIMLSPAAEPAPRSSSPTLTRSRLLAVALGGVVGGALLSLGTVYPVALHVIDSGAYSSSREGALALLSHTVAAVLATGFAALAVRLTFSDSPGVGRLALATWLTLLVSGAVAVLPAVAVARSTHFSAAAGPTFVEVLIVAACCAGGMALLARRLPDEPPPAVMLRR